MAENEEVSIIAHLLEVEKGAASVIGEANIESERKISQAKVAADEEFKKLYASEAEKIQSDFDTKKIQIKSDHDKLLDDYKKSIEQKSQDKAKFKALMDKVLFA